MNQSIHRFLFAVALATMAFTTAARAEDVPKGSDHPLVGRFEGSELIGYDDVGFGEYALIVSEVKNHGGIEKNADAARMVEGRVIHITYLSDKKHSTLEVFRAYQEALTANGFETLFECSNEACGGRNFNHASPGVRVSYMQFGEDDEDQRYLAAQLTRPEGDVFVAIHTARHGSSGGRTADMIYTQVDVVEVKPQETGIVVIKADEMASQIGAQGRVALYGIHFATDSAALEPESESVPTLEQIAKLLKDNPDMKLLVVGHTDNQGGFDYNIELSQQRAASVVKALTTDYGIAADRLKPWGVGYTAPTASNADDAGRAKNRRVELVEQ